MRANLLVAQERLTLKGKAHKEKQKKMEEAPLEALELTLSELLGLSRQDLFFRKVAGKQIMKALCEECGIRFAGLFLQSAAGCRQRSEAAGPAHQSEPLHARTKRDKHQ